ncbi:hypothetical protein ACDH54_27510, partial [Pseudomonas syringae]|uniref:hypothetical protein n=1 Tax=Pseudomonas syringae TaxID=317 RepID=UPI003531EC36
VFFCGCEKRVNMGVRFAEVLELCPTLTIQVFLLLFQPIAFLGRQLKGAKPAPMIRYSPTAMVSAAHTQQRLIITSGPDNRGADAPVTNPLCAHEFMTFKNQPDLA